jgi:mRNA-degrading endonuclease HigB of HigAB toxin-antitoxin module
MVSLANLVSNVPHLNAPQATNAVTIKSVSPEHVKIRAWRKAFVEIMHNAELKITKLLVRARHKQWAIPELIVKKCELRFAKKIFAEKMQFANMTWKELPLVIALPFTPTEIQKLNVCLTPV